VKVSGSGSTSSTSSSRRTGKTGSKGAFDRELRDVLGPSEAAVVDSVAPLGGVETLLAIQSVDGAGDGTTGRDARRRAAQRGEKILDQLEEVRRDLLLGVIPRDRLVRLAQMLGEQREDAGDPRLAALLDEIELRAHVELAKLDRQS